VAKFLELEERDLLAGLNRQERKDPVLLAVAFLEHIHSRLTEEFEGYPRPSQLPAHFR